MIRLVADSGSTKTDWALISVDAPVRVFSTVGLNPSLMSESEMRAQLEFELKQQLKALTVDEVVFYGAGCRPSVAPMLEQLMSEVIGCKNVSVNTDMLGAARGLCGCEPAVVCILGTGSNSCVYDGDTIADNISPLGYILGDEGSGASIGKRFIGDLFKRKYPQDILERYNHEIGLSLDEIIERVYRTPNANRFLASLVPFVKNCIDCKEVELMIVDEFCCFIQRNIAGYVQATQLPVNFVGSVAFYFSDQLTKAMEKCGYKIGKINQHPITGIIEYHKL